MKTCGFEKHINPYLDGELSGAKLRAFEEHLPYCPRCRGEVEQDRELLDALRGLEDMEVPPMLQERLHAALSNEIAKGDGRVKRKVNPWVLAPVASLALVACVVGGIYAFGGASGNGAKYSPVALKSQNAAEAPQADYGLAGAMPLATMAPLPMPAPASDSGSPARGESAQKSSNGNMSSFSADSITQTAGSDQAHAANGQKIIYRANIVTETREFDKCMGDVNAMLQKYGGYVENSQQSGVPEGYEKTQGRTAMVSLRIPVDKYGSAMVDLQGMGNLLQKNENTQDVGSQYVDTKARLDSLLTERESFMKLLEKADSTESIISLQNAITDLTVRIEQDTAQLRYWDGQVAYSTITVEIRELVIPTSIAPPDPTSLGDRANGAFYQTLSAMKKGLEDFAVWFVGFLPWLAILVVVAGVIIAIVIPTTRKRRKEAQKKAALEKNKEE